MTARVSLRMTAPACLALALMIAAASSATAQKSGSWGNKAPAKPPASRLPETVRVAKPVEMEVAPVIASRREAAGVSAEEIDYLVEEKLRQVGIEPNPLASDEVFLRRVYLDVAGRIP